MRQRMIRFIDEAVGSSELIVDQERALGAVRAMLHCYREEHTNDASIPRAYYDAFQIAIAHGDTARARIFAERAYAARVVVEGDDSPDTARLKHLAERPADHPSYGMLMDWPHASDSPVVDDGDSLEGWLWMDDYS